MKKLLALFAASALLMMTLANCGTQPKETPGANPSPSQSAGAEKPAESQKQIGRAS